MIATGAAAAPAGVALAAVGDFTGLPFFNYQYGVAKAGSDSNSWLTTQYNDWKAHYVVDVDSSQAKVARDNATHNDTVSEGIAYGMLLAVYFNDKPTFDKLYNYAKAHMCANIGGRGHLMHWKVQWDDVDISEFRLSIPHAAPYLFIDSANDREEMKWYVAPNPGNPDYWIRAATWDRKAGSASDADADMAAALVLAHYRWGGSTSSGGDLYAVEAAKMIADIAYYDTLSSGDAVFLKNGSLWGGQSGWNPSYYSPAWYRLFAKFVTSTKDNPTIGPMYGLQADQYVSLFGALIQTMDAQMQVIQAYRRGHTPLFPDWVDTTNGSPQPSKISDRRYYLDEDTSPGLDDLNGNGRLDDGGDNGIDAGDGYNMLSFNYYYDAVRIPWRIGTDYSWYGTDSSKAISQKMANFFKAKRFYVPEGETPDSDADLVDGYAIDPGPWGWSNRDGFNPNPGGVNNSATFVNFTSAVSMSMDSTFAKKCYKAMKSKGIEPYENEYHYFGNVARMLSLLYMNGKFTKPDRWVMIKSKSTGHYVQSLDPDTPMTADETDDWFPETWFDLVNLGNNRVALVLLRMTDLGQGGNQPTVTVHPSGTAYLYAANDPTAAKGGYETFSVTSYSNGDISLRCDGNGKYLRVNSSGQLVADQSRNTSSSTRFSLEFKSEW